MNRVPDRAKMRREYLRKKALSLVHASFGLALAGVFFATGFWVFKDTQLRGEWAEDAGVVVITCMLIGLCFGMVNYGTLLSWEAVKKVRSLPYVPPVHEQLPTLPAEEVLLRGSQASTAHPEELLRPAGKQESAQEELLRATTGGTAE